MFVSSTSLVVCSLSTNIGLTASIGDGILSSRGPATSGTNSSVTGGLTAVTGGLAAVERVVKDIINLFKVGIQNIYLVFLGFQSVLQYSK